MTTFEELNLILDSTKYYLSKDGVPFTPREHFIEHYNLFLNSPSEALLEMAGEHDDYLEYLTELYNSSGGGSVGAFALVCDELATLHESTIELSDEVLKIIYES